MLGLELFDVSEMIPYIAPSFGLHTDEDRYKLSLGSSPSALGPLQQYA